MDSQSSGLFRYNGLISIPFRSPQETPSREYQFWGTRLAPDSSRNAGGRVVESDRQPLGGKPSIKRRLVQRHKLLGRRSHLIAAYGNGGDVLAAERPDRCSLHRDQDTKSERGFALPDLLA